MRSLATILMFLGVCLIGNSIYAIQIVPDRVLVVELPKESQATWRETARSIDDNVVFLEWIPADQSPKAAVDLLQFQYQDLSLFKEKSTIEEIFEGMCECTVNRFPKKLTRLNILSKNDNEIIYEWILTKSYRGEHPKHGIIRLTFVDNGYQAVSYYFNGENLSEKKRKVWLTALQSAKPMQHSYGETPLVGLSIAPVLQSYVNLGKKFADWKIVQLYSFKEGVTIVSKIPSNHPNEVTEIVIETSCNVPSSKTTIESIFAREIDEIKKATNWKNVDFRVLKKTSSDIYYTYSHQSSPENPVIVNAVARSILTKDGCSHSVSYRHVMQDKATKEQILEWATDLSKVQLVKKRSSKFSLCSEKIESD